MEGYIQALIDRHKKSIEESLNKRNPYELNLNREMVSELEGLRDFYISNKEKKEYIVMGL